jgi:acyl-CoA reductase-like NAD-dependent aldehyde dehydrogenase
VTVKRLTLELGGNDAGIVLPDADPKAIAQDRFWGAFINTGQTCAALKRLYVHEDIYDAVCKELAAVAAAMPMGNGLDENNVLGPLQNKSQYDIVANLVDAARDSGARILLGGNPDTDQKGYFYPATLVADIDNNNPLVAEEQFGPALPIIKYSSVVEAVEMANGLDVGLGASVWSSDLPAAREVASRIQADSAWINKHGVVDPRIPFGGAKQSGYGLEFGVEGLKSLGVPQVITARAFLDRGHCTRRRAVPPIHNCGPYARSGTARAGVHPQRSRHLVQHLFGVDVGTTLAHGAAGCGLSNSSTVRRQRPNAAAQHLGHV